MTFEDQVRYLMDCWVANGGPSKVSDPVVLSKVVDIIRPVLPVVYAEKGQPG